MKHWGAISVVVAVALIARVSEGQLVVNGGFENPILPQGMAFEYYYAGSTSIQGWTISSGSVDVIKQRWVAHSGTQSLDLSGVTTGCGKIYQDIPTMPGMHYELSFWLSGNPEGGPTVKQATVRWDGNLVDSVSFDISNSTLADMKWVRKSYDVVAQKNTSRLEFYSLVENQYGPAFDDIDLVETPEPAGGLLLFFVMMASIRRPNRRR